MPEEMRKHGISYFVLVRQKWESGRTLTPSSSWDKGRAGNPATAFPGPQLPAPNSLVVSTSIFCPLQASFHGMYFTSGVGLCECWSIPFLGRLSAVWMQGRKSCGSWMQPWRGDHEYLHCSPGQETWQEWGAAVFPEKRLPASPWAGQNM